MSHSATLLSLPALTAPCAAAVATTEPPAALREQMRSLGRHLRHCRAAQGRFFGLNRLALALHGWVAPRFVTTLAVAGVALALICA